MLDGASLSAIIMAGLALIGAGFGQIKHCKSGCCEFDTKEGGGIPLPVHELSVPIKKPEH